VPKELKLNGSKEKFNIQVVYDIKELYGKVTGRRQFTIYRE